MGIGTRRSTPLGVIAAVLALVMIVVVGGSSATAVSSGTESRGTVAHNADGKMKSTISGTTADGRAVAGSFTPLRFVKKDGKLNVKGVIDGVIKNADGSTQTFTVLRTMKVKKIDGRKLGGLSRTSADSAAACDILNLVLGPLHLDLLGLVVDLNQVVLNVTAVPGAGNLLGNLLCSVAGLLDGGPLAGLLGQLSNLLNQILAALNLGL